MKKNLHITYPEAHKRVAKSMQSIVQNGLAREAHREVTRDGQSIYRSIHE